MDDEIKDTDKDIRIYSVSGGTDRDQNDLMNCYFAPVLDSEEYHFFNQTGKQIFTAPARLTPATKSFMFVYGGFLWTVNNFELDLLAPPNKASGNWVNNDPGLPQEDGHFQAQAGGGSGEEKSAAYAGA